MALLFEIAHNGVSAKISFPQNFFDLHQILLLQCHFEQIVGVVYFGDNHLSLPVDTVHLILHEESHIEWLFNTLEVSCSLAFTGKHVLDVSRS